MMTKDETWQEVPVWIICVVGRPPVTHVSIAGSETCWATTCDLHAFETHWRRDAFLMCHSAFIFCACLDRSSHLQTLSSIFSLARSRFLFFHLSPNKEIKSNTEEHNLLEEVFWWERVC